MARPGANDNWMIVCTNVAGIRQDGRRQDGEPCVPILIKGASPAHFSVEISSMNSPYTDRYRFRFTSTSRRSELVWKTFELAV